MTNFMVSGNIVKDAATRMATSSNGTKSLVTDFSVAVRDGYGESQTTQFWKVTLWGDRGANLAKYLTKGRRVDVKGLPTVEKPWQGEDGQLHNGNLRIMRAEVELVGANKSDNGELVEGEEYVA